jgi:acetyl-CoA synthetase
MVPGSCTLPFPGIQAAIVDETGKDVPTGRAVFWCASAHGLP